MTALTPNPLSHRREFLCMIKPQLCRVDTGRGGYFLSLERIRNIPHDRHNHGEADLKRNVEEACDPGNNERREEGDNESDDCETDRVNGSFDLLLISCGEDERNTPHDDEDETQDEGGNDCESDECCDDVHDGTFFEEFAEHDREGGKPTSDDVRGALILSG